MLLYVLAAIYLLVWAGLSTYALIWIDRRQLDPPNTREILFVEAMLSLWPCG